MINKIKLVIGLLLCLGNPLSAQALTCDANLDNVVDQADIELILKFSGTPVGNDLRAQNVDVNGNGIVDTLDAHQCVLAFSVQLLTCDANLDNVVDRTDIELILKYLGTPFGDDPRAQNVDLNPNGIVDILDARRCAAQQCTAPSCNRPPIANAGSDQPAPPVGTTVILDGSGSTDPEGDRLTYQWELTQVPPGSQASLSDKTAVRPTFIVDKSGTYQVTLVVNDGNQNSLHPAQVNISTANTCPIANAGDNKNVVEGLAVTLDGTNSTDVDGDKLTYRWSLIAVPLDSNAVLSDPTAVKPSFLADKKGEYQAQLVVNDGKCDSKNIAIVIINRGNIPPVANAGPDQAVHLPAGGSGIAVTLDGSGSSDADGDPLTYRWSLTTRPAGSKAVLSDPSAIKPSFVVDQFGDYVAQLIVNDGTEDSKQPDTVIISTANIKPVADAGTGETFVWILDKGVINIITAGLNGSGSSDADGDPLTYRWSLITLPAGSGAVLSDPFAINSGFRVDEPGIYVAQLIVNDGTEDSEPDTVTTTIIGDASPAANAGINQSFLNCNATQPTTVQLNGQGSDNDGFPGGPLTYKWTLISPSGSNATLSNPNIANPTLQLDRLGTWAAQLIVNDGLLDSQPSTVNITCDFLG